jgi:hypothetical protein
MSRDAVGVNDEPLSPLRTLAEQFVSLLVGHPDRRGVAFLLGLSLQQHDIDASIRRPVVGQRARDASSGVRRVPWFQPRAHALFEVGNYAVGHAGINVFEVSHAPYP